MFPNPIPFFCLPFITRRQEECTHPHPMWIGGWHFSAGDVWDDITYVCPDCGINLEASTIPLDLSLPGDIPL